MITSKSILLVSGISLFCFFKTSQVKAITPFIFGIISNGIFQGAQATQQQIDATQDLIQFGVEESITRSYTIPLASALQAKLYKRIAEIKDFANDKKDALNEYISMLNLVTSGEEKYGRMLYDYQEVYRDRQSSKDLDSENLVNYLGTGADFNEFWLTEWHRFNFMEEDVKWAEKIMDKYFTAINALAVRIMIYATFGGDVATNLMDNALEFGNRSIKAFSDIEEEFGEKTVYYSIKGFADVFYGTMDLYLNL